MQRMTDFCQIVSMSFNSPLRFYSVIEEPLALLHFETLGVSLFCHRTLALPESSLDFLSVLLRFSLFEAVEKPVRYSKRAILI